MCLESGCELATALAMFIGVTSFLEYPPGRIHDKQPASLRLQSTATFSSCGCMLMPVVTWMWWMLGDALPFTMQQQQVLLQRRCAYWTAGRPWTARMTQAPLHYIGLAAMAAQRLCTSFSKQMRILISGTQLVTLRCTKPLPLVPPTCCKDCSLHMQIPCFVTTGHAQLQKWPHSEEPPEWWNCCSDTRIATCMHNNGIPAGQQVLRMRNEPCLIHLSLALQVMVVARQGATVKSVTVLFRLH